MLNYREIERVVEYSDQHSFLYRNKLTGSEIIILEDFGDDNRVLNYYELLFKKSFSGWTLRNNKKKRLHAARFINSKVEVVLCYNNSPKLNYKNPFVRLILTKNQDLKNATLVDLESIENFHVVFIDETADKNYRYLTEEKIIEIPFQISNDENAIKTEWFEFYFKDMTTKSLFF